MQSLIQSPKDESGQDTIEYALMLALIAVGTASAVTGIATCYDRAWRFTKSAEAAGLSLRLYKPPLLLLFLPMLWWRCNAVRSRESHCHPGASKDPIAKGALAAP
jgi:Flp pilus assembly pilin Flp